MTNELVFLKNGLFLELTSLGFAYSLVQHYSKNAQIKIFEASPTPRGAILILMSSSSKSLETIATEILSNDQNKPFIENSWLGQNLSESLIEAYLNQVLAPLKENLILIETESVCEAVKAAAMALENSLEICEFRTLRSAVYKCCLSLTSIHSKNEIEKIFGHTKDQRNFRLNYFEKPTQELRNQYNLA